MQCTVLVKNRDMQSPGTRKDLLKWTHHRLLFVVVVGLPVQVRGPPRAGQAAAAELARQVVRVGGQGRPCAKPAR